MHALVDFDPHGIAILRTYRYGSKRLGHENEAKVPSMKWLGIRSNDVLARGSNRIWDDLHLPDSQSSLESVSYSQEGMTQIYRGVITDTPIDSDGPRPYKRTRTQEPRETEESILYLTEKDRKKAIKLMTGICGSELDDDALEQLHELQRMLMLGIKAEIQALDDFGDLSKWLDERLKPV